MRGGERVLGELCGLFPQARVYAMLWNRGSVDERIERRVAGVSFLDRLPGVRFGYRNYLPLYPAAIRALELPSCDLVLSTSHAVALGVRAPRGAKHVSYIHTPMRYAWGFAPGPADPLRRAALGVLRPWLRGVDRRHGDNPDFLIANSENVQQRIRRAWGRESEVIHPPADIELFQPGVRPREDFYLVAGSLQPYKSVDLAVRACARSSRELMIAGDGPERGRLEAAAAPNVRFLGRVSDAELGSLYQRCRALLFPGLEDFGLTPVEAQACGTPVVAFRGGGALETVVDGETGVFFDRRTPESLAEAMERLELSDWDPKRIRRNAERFSTAVFRAKLEAFLRARVGFPFD